MRSLTTASGPARTIRRPSIQPYDGAPKAKILPVTVQGAEGTAIIAPDAVAAGIDRALDHGADVINVSQGSSADADAMLCS